MPGSAPRRPRNDVRQYDDLAAAWWQEQGPFAALHWLARARARLVPPPSRMGAVLVDVACGGGLLAPHVQGYRHVGVDLNAAALRSARARGLDCAQGDATALPLAEGVADVVVAGEVIEHVADLESLVAELVRVCRPGGTIVVDTIADTAWARFSLVTVGERLPGGPPRRIHDPNLFVSPQRLRALFAGQGVRLRVTGLRPHPGQYVAYVLGRARTVHMEPTTSLSAVYQGVGRKSAPVPAREGR